MANFHHIVHNNNYGIALDAPKATGDEVKSFQTFFYKEGPDQKRPNETYENDAS